MFTHPNIIDLFHFYLSNYKYTRSISWKYFKTINSSFNVNEFHSVFTWLTWITHISYAGYKHNNECFIKNNSDDVIIQVWCLCVIFWQFQILSRAFYGLCINSIRCKTGGNYLAVCYEYIPSAIFISPLNQVHAIAKNIGNVYQQIYSNSNAIVM